MNRWMACTTCTQTVIANPTGVCLACQRGFTHKRQEDHYLYNKERMPCGDYFPPEDLERWNQLKEKRHALEERLKQEDDLAEHQDRDESGKTPEAGGSYRPINCS